MVENLESEIDRLETLGLRGLRKYWTNSLGGPPPPWQSVDLLRRTLAYKIQEEAAGGLSLECARRLRKISREVERGVSPTPNGVTRLKPGTILTREWQGTLFQVRVLEDGFEYEGERLSSLSEVGRKITRTRWSGPLFFGLKK